MFCNNHGKVSKRASIVIQNCIRVTYKAFGAAGNNLTVTFTDAEIITYGSDPTWLLISPTELICNFEATGVAPTAELVAVAALDQEIDDLVTIELISGHGNDVVELFGPENLTGGA